MKAYKRINYGGPETLKLEEDEKPNIKKDQVLVKVMANSPNPVDWHILRGKPGIMRLAIGLFKPKNKTIGSDFAGIVEKVGENVNHFKPGDRVFGDALRLGAFAEYISVSAKKCGLIPRDIDFQTMAGIPIAGVSALQALRTYGELCEGDGVFINGASGGVGHFAIQIAKAYGAEVTAVCSEKNIEFVKKLGADHTLAYDKEPIKEHTGKYRVVLDAYGNLTHNDYKRLGKQGVVVGFLSVGHMFSTLFKKAFSDVKLKPFAANTNTRDLEKLANMVEQKKITVYFDKVYSYDEIPVAMKQIESMHTTGKISIVW